jgi:hypothetical protein
MSEEIRELIAAEMGDDRFECPLCLDYVSPNEKCSCSSWTEEELREFMKSEESEREEFQCEPALILAKTA